MVTGDTLTIEKNGGGTVEVTIDTQTSDNVFELTSSPAGLTAGDEVFLKNLYISEGTEPNIGIRNPTWRPAV